MPFFFREKPENQITTSPVAKQKKLLCRVQILALAQTGTQPLCRSAQPSRQHRGVVLEVGLRVRVQRLAPLCRGLRLLLDEREQGFAEELWGGAGGGLGRTSPLWSTRVTPPT